MEKQISLKKESATYKMVIPAKVENKIRQLLSSIHNIEWSGVLFYNYAGTLEKGDLVITCEDVFPMNIGTTGFTQFEITPDVASYMVHNDLMECQQGLIHSHHSMATFFSGTDTDTLAKEGADRNNFVSLIVNNAGKYNAAITWKETISLVGTETRTIPFFDMEDVKSTVKERTLTQSCIKYAMLNVEIEQPAIDQKLAERISALWKEKNFRFNRAFPDREGFEYQEDWERNPFDFAERHPEMTEIFQGVRKDSFIKTQSGNAHVFVEPKTTSQKAVKNNKIQPSYIKTIALQIMAGSLTAKYNNNNYTLSKKEIESIKKSMEARLKDGMLNETTDILEEFADIVVHNAAQTIYDELITKDYTADADYNDILSDVKDKVREILVKYVKDLPYLKTAIDGLNTLF